MNPPRALLALSLIFACFSASVVHAGESLAARIDQLVEAAQASPVAALASDAEFLRRVTLDLHGLIPSSAEARAFIDDPSPHKREVLVDRLIASPRFAVHMAEVFDVMLMERRPDRSVKTPDWQKYLQTAFEKNVPFDQLTREILNADGVDPNLRPAARFFLDRDSEPHLMTRDIGRIFFGMDLQCAQCHDHPLVDHYLQTDYYGLFAFVNRSTLFPPLLPTTDLATTKFFVAEKADGDANYKSVFTQDEGRIRPQLPGENEIDEPRFRQGEDYIVAPLPNARSVPKYSRRAKLAELATNGANRQFNVNIANRLWALMMGRGLVHPVDLHHSLNPPSNPALLDLIANEFVAMKFDVRGFLRELALTRTYQRSIDPPTTDPAEQLATAATQIPTLEADYVARKAAADESRKSVDAAQTEFKTARVALSAAETAWRTAETAVGTAKKPLEDSQAAVAKSQDEATAKQTAIQAINEASAKSTEVAKLLPNDKEIAAAVATFTAKQQQLTGELAAVQKTIADLTAAQPPLQAKLTESYPPADAAYAAYLEARKPVDLAKTNLVAVWNRHKADAFASAVSKRRLENAQADESYLASLAAVAEKRVALATIQTELAAVVQAAEQQQAAVTSQASTMATLEAMAAETRKSFEEAKSQFDARQTVVQAVADAVSKTETALQSLPGDADLTQALGKLKERLEPLKKEATTLKQALAGRDAAVKEMSTRMTASQQAMAVATAEMANRQQAVLSKTNDVNQTQSAVREAESTVVSGRSQLVDLWTVGSGVRTYKQLTPEQIGWATLQATGVLEPQRAAADAEVEKTQSKASVASDIALAKAREMKLEQHLNEQMRGNVSPFVSLYASSAGQPQDDFFATPDQALFVANGGTVIGWAAGGQLAQRLTPLTDDNAFAEELYLSTLTRRPTPIEVQETAQFLAARATERPQAIRDLIWSLLTSVEFRFNH